MKLFLKNTILFLAIFYSSIFITLMCINYTINRKADFKLKPNINKIVIGNSHPAGTYNDSLISNFSNLADPGDCYFYGYLKLKEILRHNTQVDSVYVEFYPNTILEWEDSKLWRKHQIPNYLAFFDINDHLLLLSDNSLGYQQELLNGIKSNLKRVFQGQYNFKDSIGGYRYVKTFREDIIKGSVDYNPEIQYDLNEKQLSKLDISYLKKIVNLCKEKKKEIIFIRSPYHKKFNGRKYESIFQDYRRKNYDSIPFLDFKDFPFEDDEFKDLEHLNYKGARKFSLWFEKNKDLTSINY